MRFRWKCKLRRRCDSSVGFTSTNEQWISFLSPRRQAMACCKALWHVSASRCYYTAGSTSTTAILDLWPKQDAASLSLSLLSLYLLRLYFPRFIVRRRVRLDRLMGHLRNQRITSTTIRASQSPPLAINGLAGTNCRPPLYTPENCIRPLTN